MINFLSHNNEGFILGVSSYSRLSSLLRQTRGLINIFNKNLPTVVFQADGLFELYFDIYLLLTKFKGCTISYGPSFFLLDLWPKHEARRP